MIAVVICFAIAKAATEPVNAPRCPRAITPHTWVLLVVPGNYSELQQEPEVHITGPGLPADNDDKTRLTVQVLEHTTQELRFEVLIPEIPNLGLTFTDGFNLEVKHIGSDSHDIKVAASNGWGGKLAAAVVFLALGFLAFLSGGTKDRWSLLRGWDGMASLGQFQMLWWTLVTASCFTVVWVNQLAVMEIDDSVLALLGVSAVSRIASGQLTTVNSKRRAFEWTDLLREEADTPLSVARLQALVFTVLLGVVAISTACLTSRLPHFDSQYIILLGISNGTYLTSKMGMKSRVQNPLSIQPSTNSSQITVTGPPAQMEAKLLLADVSVIDVTSTANWKTSDPKVATVDSLGRVQGIATGSTLLEAQYSDKSVTVPIRVTP